MNLKDILPDFAEEDDRLMTREQANSVMWFLLGVLAGGTLLACFAITTAAGAVAFTSAALVVWLIMFMVWLLWA